MADKIFVGNGKKNEKYDMVNFSICLSDLPKEFIEKSEKNGKSYIKLTISSNKNGEDKFGNTHNVTVNTWKPDKQEATTAPAAPEDSLPF